MASEINISLEIERLVQYGLSKKLISKADSPVIRNSLYDLLKVETPQANVKQDTEIPDNAGSILNGILQHCFENGILCDSTVTQRDLLSAKIMGIIAPKQSEVFKKFKKRYISSPAEATEYLYGLCVDLNYIQKQRGQKNFNWDNEEPYGRLELTSNFQIPEKTEEEIELRDKTEKPPYPPCRLCVENVGFAGNLWRGSGLNLRVAPITLCGSQFYIRNTKRQYYSNRFFVTSERHEPLELNEKTFEMMLEYADSFPHCFIGIEAGLPDMGNNYPEHGFFHSGCHSFPAEFAHAAARYRHELFDDVEAEILNWPVSIIRLSSGDAYQLAKISNYVNGFWKEYSDEEFNILAFTPPETTETPHNALSSFVRKNPRGRYEVYLILRNNRADEEHPLGIFSHGEEHRHVMADNIGLTKAMGLATFPGSFDYELLRIMGVLISGKKYSLGENPQFDRHSEWINELIEKYGVISNYETSKSVVLFEAARKYARILEGCGLFKMTEEGLGGFKTLMEDLGFIEEEEY